MPFARFFSLVSMALAALLLAACSGDKPESVVEQFYEAAAKGDVEDATDLISFANVPANQMVAAKGKVQMVVGEMNTRISANEGLDEVKIVETNLDESGKTAQVKATLVFNNGKEKTENVRLIKDDGDWKLLLK